MRGRQFGFLALMVALWCAGRLLLAGSNPDTQQLAEPETVAAQPPQRTSRRQIRHRAYIHRRKHEIRSAGRRPSDATMPLPWLVPPHDGPPSETPVIRGPADQFQEPPATMATFVPAGNTPITQHRALSFYGYSFFRKASQAGRPALGGQYGGSQSGFVATWDIDRLHGSRKLSGIALLGRGALAHGDTTERELAAGIRWRPHSRLPVSLSIERRFLHARSDANAAYLAGGTTLALPSAFRLDTFAQAGIVSGPAGGPFADFSAHVDRKIIQRTADTARAGAGIWAGGQNDIFRIDIGPTIRGDIAISDGHLHVSADWRFRIAGEATPASGPAMTLSTSF